MRLKYCIFGQANEAHYPSANEEKGGGN